MKQFAAMTAAFGLTLSLAACGGGNDAEKAVEDFGQAVQDKDYKAVCDFIDPALVKQLEDAGQNCPDLMKEGIDDMDVPQDGKVNIKESKIADDDKTATVTVEDKDGKEQKIKLKKVKDEWKLDAGV